MVLESVILSAFGAVLLGSLLFHVKIVYALLVGLCLFVGYALARSFSWREVLSMCWRGVKTTRGLLLLFVLIGLLTALWRASGTIPVIVSYASNLIHPQSFILVAFLLNAAMSLLTGSALGTAATMGVICATMAQTMGINPAWVGGAILSGSYFGNRLSPISSMALLTANITGTEIYSNVRNMLRTSWFPLLLSCAVYLVVGFCFSGELGEVALSSAKSVRELFAQEFSLSLWGVLPAILMVVLSMLRVKSSRVLLSSALCALVIALLVEYRDVASLWEFLVYGFHSQMPDLSKMINGGGLLSMVNVFLIVFIAGCFGGIFKGTELLSPLKKCVCFLEKKHEFVCGDACGVYRGGLCFLQPDAHHYFDEPVDFFCGTVAGTSGVGSLRYGGNGDCACAVVCSDFDCACGSPGFVNFCLLCLFLVFASVEQAFYLQA